MNRRNFMTTVSAAALFPSLALAVPGSLEYAPGLVKARLLQGETLFVDFYTSWCVTCAAQRRVIGTLLNENPAYQQAITFIGVDWDIYRKSELSRDLGIPRRSTLVVLKGDQELGRIVAGTTRSSIKALLDIALAATTA